MVVVEDEIKRARKGVHLVDEGSRQCLDSRGLRRAKRGQNTLPDALIDGPQRSHQVGEEAHRVIVAFVQ